MHTLFALSISLILSLASLQSFAREYIIEAIVFTNESNTQTVSSEGLENRSQNSFGEPSGEYRIATEPRIVRARARLNKSIADSSSIESPAEATPGLVLVELATAKQNLDANPKHRVLQALSWGQSEADFSNSPLINVGNGQTLSGTIRIYAPSLLFAELILRYAPGDVLSVPDPSLPQYFIDEQRKLKLNEVHYFDQAHFGVILTVRPSEDQPASE